MLWPGPRGRVVTGTAGSVRLTVTLTHSDPLLSRWSDKVAARLCQCATGRRMAYGARLPDGGHNGKRPEDSVETHEFNRRILPLGTKKKLVSTSNNSCTMVWEEMKAPTNLRWREKEGGEERKALFCYKSYSMHIFKMLNFLLKNHPAGFERHALCHHNTILDDKMSNTAGMLLIHNKKRTLARAIQAAVA